MDPNLEPLCFAIQLYKQNDFMKYHFDTNFTLGTRYTIVIPLYINKYNESYLFIKDKNNVEKKVVINIGKVIIYNGDKVYHKVSKQSTKGKRISLIINLTTNPNYNFFGKIMQNIRNFMFINYTW